MSAPNIRSYSYQSPSSPNCQSPKAVPETLSYQLQSPRTVSGLAWRTNPCAGRSAGTSIPLSILGLRSVCPSSCAIWRGACAQIVNRLSFSFLILVFIFQHIAALYFFCVRVVILVIWPSGSSIHSRNHGLTRTSRRLR
jgi:hypothetical protein